jgi:hypothetical protein
MSEIPRRLIFSINSGRCGSRYLAGLLATAEDMRAFHEAEPTMSGPFLQMLCDRPPAASFARRSIKAHVIRRTLGRLPERCGYAETNHMFIKTFHDVVMEHFRDCDIRVIVLRRYLPAVLKSFITMGYFSDRNTVWPAWMPLPGTCDSAFLPPQPPEDQYDLAIGYLLDIEARIERFRSCYPGAVLLETSLESLQAAEHVMSLFAGLGLQPSARTAAVTGRITNMRSARKAAIGLDTTLEYCRRRIEAYLENCVRLGAVVPPLRQLQIPAGEGGCS